MLFWILIIIYLGIVIKCYWDDGILFATMSLIFGALLLLIVIFMLAVISNETGLICKKWSNSIPIVSLKTESTLQGSFILGCGSVESSELYYFMEDLGNNKYCRASANTYNTIIKESNTESPSYTEYFTYSRNKYLVPDWDIFKFSNRSYRELTVPKGTIVVSFKID